MIKCEVCGKELNRLTQHLMNQHRMTKRQYLKMFPNAKFISEESKAKAKAWHDEPKHKELASLNLSKSHKRG